MLKKNRKKEKKRKDYSKQELWEKLSDKTLLPQEIMTSSCCITSIGQRELVIENYKSILDYQNDRLTLLTGQGRVEIVGKALEILYYGKEEIKVRGKIETIIYKK